MIARRSTVVGLLIALLGGTAAAQARPAARPDSLLLEANITFLYYRDVPRAQRFYEDILGLRLTVDQGYAKIYRMSRTSYVGLVDEAQGLHRASDAKPVTLSFVTRDVDAWYRYLRGRGVPMVHELANGTRQPTRGFVARDPEGYYLEFEDFRDDLQNASIRIALDAPNPPPRHPDAMAFVSRFIADYFAVTEEPTPADSVRRAAINARLLPALRRALAADRAAQMDAEGVIVGLDFDPFLAAQDPCDTYAPREAAMVDGRVHVAVYCTSGWGHPLMPEAIYVLERQGTRFLIADILYPGSGVLTDILEHLARDRATPPAR